MEKNLGVFSFGCFLSSIFWCIVLTIATGSTKIQYEFETDQTNKREIALYVKEYPELSKIRDDAYSKNKCISNGDYYKIRKEYNYLAETKK